MLEREYKTNEQKVGVITAAMVDEYSVIDPSITNQEENESTFPLYEEVDVKIKSVPVDSSGPHYSMITTNKKEPVAVDNDNSDTEHPVATEANICYQTGLSATTAQKNVSTAHTISNQQIGKQDTAKTVICKRFICILVTITLVTIISLVCLAVLAILFLEVTKLKNQLASVQNQQMQIEMKPIDQNLLNIQQLNTSIDMILQQLSIIQSQTQQLTNSSTMLQQQLTALHNQTQQLSDSNITLQQQLTELHNQIQQLSDSTMLQQQLTALHNQTQQLSDSNITLQRQLTVLHDQIQQLSDSNITLQQQLTVLHNQTQELSDSNITLQQQLTVLHNQIQQLSDSNTMLRQQQNDTEVLKNNLFGQFPFYPTASCATLPPSYPSGYYWVRASNGSAVSVYCDMTLPCGGVTGGWMRVAELDMTNSSHQCPSGLMEHNDSPNIRTCVRNETSGGCSSVELSTANIQYTIVCGRITAYQFGYVDYFESTDINSAYVDGVSLTHGIPRQHIWTFAAAGRGGRICLCRSSPRPDAVGQDFFCDTGNPAFSSTAAIFYADNPLWDGDGCAPGNVCCSNDNPPYFNKTLSGPTTDNIEMRVCRDEGASNEDIAIESVEIYAQ